MSSPQNLIGSKIGPLIELWKNSKVNKIMKYTAMTAVAMSVVLAACGLMSSKYDNVEYMHLVYLNIAADNQHGCNHVENESILFYSKVLTTYSKHTTNKNITDTYGKIQALSQELVNRERPSDAYCNIKKQTIKELTDQALAVYGGRSR